MPSDADMAAALETANGAGARSMLHGVFALSLTCMAGYLDAVGYTHLAGLYVSFMSGNSTRLGLAIAEGDRKLLVPCAVVIIGFVAGAFIGSLIANAVSRFKLTAILATEIALLLSTIALSLDTASYAALLPICVAMGIQNAAHETIAGAELGKSFITGFLFNLGKALAHLAQGRGGAARALAYCASWSAFLLGVVVGSLALEHFGLTGALSGAAGGCWLSQSARRPTSSTRRTRSPTHGGGRPARNGLAHPTGLSSRQPSGAYHRIDES